MPRRLHRATADLLHASVSVGLLPFAGAVVAQAASAAPGPGDAAWEAAVAEQLLGVVRAAGGAGAEAAAADLARDPVLLAALFQNVDLLPPAGDATADAVSALVLHALHHLGAAG
jgi:hypothetical protein